MDKSTSRVSSSIKGNLPLNTQEFNEASVRLNLFDPEIMGIGPYLKLRYLLVYLKRQEQKINEEKKKLEKFYSDQINEYTNIYHLSEHGKAKYFIDSVGDLYEAFIKSQMKYGILQSKSKHFGRWKDKQSKLDVPNKMLIMKQGEKQKKFDLMKYILSPEIEMGNEHYRFKMIAKSKDVKQKEVVLGSIYKEITEIWFNCISNVIHPPTMKSIVVKPEDRSGQFEGGGQRSKSNQKQNNNTGFSGGLLAQSMMDISHNNGSDEQEHGMDKREEIHNKVKSKSNVVQPEGKKQYEEHQTDQSSPKQVIKKEAGTTTNNIVGVEEKKEPISKGSQKSNNTEQVISPTKKDSGKKEQVHQKVPLTPEQQRSDLQNKENSDQNMRQSPQIAQEKKNTQEQTVSVQPGSPNQDISDKKNNQSPAPLQAPTSPNQRFETKTNFQQYESQSQVGQEINSSKQQIQNEIIFPPTPPLTPPNNQQSSFNSETMANKNEEIKEIELENDMVDAVSEQEQIVPVEVQLRNFERQVNVPQIFQELVPIIDIEDLQSEFNYKVAHTKESLRILQNVENKKKFKLIMTLKAQQQKVFDIISNTEHYNKWNPNISETKIVSLIKSDNTAIIYQKNRAYGRLYQPRDFVFLRYAFFKNGVYHIIDKSVDHQNYPPYYTVVRGEIDHYFWCIMKHPDNPNDSILIKDFEVSNAGYVSEDQDGSMTLEYLKCFEHLDNFLRQVSFQIYDRNNFANIFDLSSEVKFYEEKKQQLEVQLKQKKNEEMKVNYKVIQDDLVIDRQPKHQEQKQEIVAMTTMDIVKIRETENEIINDTGKEKDQELKEEIEEEKKKMAKEEEVDEQMEEEIFQRNRRSQSLFVAEEKLKYTASNSSTGTLSGMDFQKQLLEIVDKQDHHRRHLGHKYQLEPAEKNDANEKRIANSPEDHYVFHNDWRRDESKGTMYFVNKQALEAQQKVIKYLIKQLGGNLLSGKSLTTISMPVDIFECRSNLERFAYSFSMAPTYFEAASQSNDPVEQMKSSVAFTISMSLLYLNLEKPFNPILGETYQGFINGCPVYCQQISHHPPIAAFQLIGRGYVLEGYLESTAEFHANSVTGMNFGKLKVRFHNTKAQFYLFTCPGELFNTAIGDRYFNLEGRLLVYEERLALVADVVFNPDKKGALSFGKQKTPSDYFAGSIYQLNSKGMQKLAKEQKQYKFQGVNTKDEVEKELSKVQGIWTQHLKFDGIPYWKRNEPLPHIMDHQQFPLPSDCNYRKDIIYRRLNDRIKSQEWKETLEVAQRADRKNREKVEKQKGIKKKQH